MKIPKTLSAALVALAATTTLNAADLASSYPLKTCVVSGEGVDEMGKPYVFTYEGQEVQLCCKNCRKKFDKDPEKYMKKIQAAGKGEASKSQD